ncbi:MAG: asparagine synthase (glutamine-hydrolyzing) [Bacteroidales bacterium]
MCGINGFISLNNSFDFNFQKNLKSKINQMNDLISHRGPDSDGIYIKNPICFGFRRLSIIDLTDTANQPMVSNDEKIVIVFNGEIYNYIEIKKELINKGYLFKTQSDTEVVINSYIEFGFDCVQKFNGMWAFAIYDFRNNRLFCSRDRFGVKPFYYFIDTDSLLFSSELKSLHSTCNLKRANVSKVYEYLAYGYRANDGETFLENCFELLPGTNLIYENMQLRYHKYWTLNSNQFEHNDQKNIHEEYINLFESAVKLRYRSDVPVALLLSGGLDSSSIAKVTDNLIERGELGQNDVHAYIASFPDFKDDETSIAREFVKTCKHIKLHEMVIRSENIVNHFEKIIYGLDHPLFSFTSIAHNNIMKECSREGIKVVLNGQGSDEAYAGYIKYISGVHLLDQLLSHGGDFLKEFHQLHIQNKYSKPFLIGQMIKSTLSQPYSSYLRAKCQEKSISCFNKDFIRENYRHYNSEYKFSLKGNNFNKYLLNQINHQGLNAILHYEDISSMQQSIEIRSPFMDYRLMEFAFSIPNELKFKNGVTKVIQRETIGTMLPDSITKNRKKIGFNTPFKEYFSDDPIVKSYIFNILNSTSFKSKKIWNANKIINVFENPSKYPKFPFWRVINLEVWSKVYNINNL